MIVGFIGLGNLGEKLAATLLRNNINLIVHDKLKKNAVQLIEKGANWEDTPIELAKKVTLLLLVYHHLLFLPESWKLDTVLLKAFQKVKIWIEMSTTSKQEVSRLSKLVQNKGGFSADCPVSGGCHRASTGNISIFSGCERKVFEKIKPILL